jgi:CBS domain-containing protein
MLRARDVMQSNVSTVEPGQSLSGLDEMLVRDGVSGMPVLERGEVVGVVSRADIVRAFDQATGAAAATQAYYHDVAGAALDPGTVARMSAENVAAKTVRDVMTSQVVAVSPDDPLPEVARILIDRRMHRILVVEGRRLAGILTTVDLVSAIADGRLVPAG